MRGAGFHLQILRLDLQLGHDPDLTLALRIFLHLLVERGPLERSRSLLGPLQLESCHQRETYSQQEACSQREAWSQREAYFPGHSKRFLRFKA